jgi:hypothetical protein
MRLVKTRALYIKTAHVLGGDPYDFTLEMPKDVLSCGANEIMRVSLSAWSVYLSWSNVTPANNQLRLAGTTITIPPGNYTFTTLAELITELYAANAMSVTTLNVAYLAPSNHFSFVFNTLAQVEFLNESWSILGFTSGATRIGFTVESDTAVKPRLVDNLKVALRGITPTNYAFEVAEDGTIRNVDYLVNIPITAPPYSLNVWRSLVDGDASLFIADKTIRELRVIVFEERDDALATFLPHSEMVLKVDTFIMNDTQEQLAHLSKISEYSRLQFLQQGLAQAD